MHIYVSSCAIPRESNGKITPLSHLLHLREDIWVPNSVGSEHRGHAHAKYLPSSRCSLRSIVGSNECV